MFVSTSWLMLAYLIEREWEDLRNQMNQLQIQWLLKDSDKGIQEWKYWQNRNYYHFELALAWLFTRKKRAIFDKLNTINDIADKVVDKAFKELFKKSDAELLRNYTERTGIIQKNESFKDLLVEQINDTAEKMQRNEVKNYTSLLNEIEEKHKKNLDDLLNLPKEERLKKEKENLVNEIIEAYNAKPDKRAINESRRIELERDLRTYLQREATAITINVSKQNGFYLFICNSLKDSADDHCNYQGKVYITKDYKKIVKKEMLEQVETYVKTNNILFLEDIIDGTIKYHWTLKNGEKRERGVFLTTRWNCRHYFTPITFNEALNPQKTLQDKELSTGKYNPENYKALQTQRALEREIRALKSKRLILKEQLKYATNDYVLKQDLKIVNAKIKECETALNNLLEKYNLPRSYNREQVEALTYDLGIS